MDDSIQGSINLNEGISYKAKESRKTFFDYINYNQSSKVDLFRNNEMVSAGPNVNLKFANAKKESYTTIEKENFQNKIKTIQKTELCKNWELYGNCYYKDSCSFAHGETELRKKSKSLNLKYKTKKCVVYKSNMYCPFGARCQYSHVLPHSKLLSYKYKLKYFANFLLKEAVLANGDFELICLIANRKYQRYVIYFYISSARLKYFKKMFREKKNKQLDK